MGTQARVYAWRVSPLVGMGLRALMQGEADVEFAAAYWDLAEMSAALQENPIVGRVVVVAAFPAGFDLPFAELEGKRSRSGQLGVIALLPVNADEALIVRGLRTGANGFLLESVSLQMALAAVRAVASGKSYLGPEVAPVALAELRRNTFVPYGASASGTLTEREQMIVQLAADGLSNVEIAAAVGLAEKTIRNLWSGLFDKVGMEDRTQVILWAIRTGQVEIH